MVDHDISKLRHFLHLRKEARGQGTVFMKYFERVRIARGGSKGLVRNDMACNIHARLDHHLQGSLVLVKTGLTGFLGIVLSKTGPSLRSRRPRPKFGPFSVHEPSAQDGLRYI